MALKKFVIIFTLLCCLFKQDQARNKTAEPFIYGGSESEIGQFPYMAYIQYSDISDVYSCSGCLVTERHVLTAAHCFFGTEEDPQKVHVFAGLVDLSFVHGLDVFATNETAGFQERVVEKMIINEDYDPIWFFHDVAIIIVGKPFEMTQHVQYAGISTDKIYEPINCTIHGWGSTRENNANKKLMYAIVLAIPVSYGCPATYMGDFYCLLKGGPGICRGDSGGPLVCNSTVRGVASYVSGTYESAYTCGESAEDVYVDLSGETKFLKHLDGSPLNIASMPRIALTFVYCVGCWVNYIVFSS